jgi:hypothetical protein
MSKVNRIAATVYVNKSRSWYWAAMGAGFFTAMVAVRAPIALETTAAQPTIAAPAAPVLPATPVAPMPPVVTTPSATTAQPEHTYTGRVVSFDPKEHVLTVKGRMFSRKEFNFGDDCAFTFLYAMLNNNDGPANDLRRGEKVTVRYQDVQGVLIADRIVQQPMQFAGLVRRIDPGKHTLTIRRRVGDKQLDVATECIVVLGHDKAGALADIHPADQVIVSYETPDDRPVAWQITKTNMTSAAR